MNMRTTRRKNRKPTETHYSRPSNPGDIVLDPFAGSFTTGAVAIASGRNSLVLRSTASTSKWGFDGWM
ncbi:DNA methyltransferase [Shigella flexneri]